jgi:hypothetical protein
VINECQWIERCERDAEGDAAHPVLGVIPVCGPHVAQFGIPLITTTKES